MVICSGSVKGRATLYLVDLSWQVAPVEMDLEVVPGDQEDGLPVIPCQDPAHRHTGGPYEN